MDNLDQVLIVKPECQFRHIAEVLARMGWQRDQVDLAAPTLVPGEPEVASWSWGGRKPLLIYTFNPVVKMRVLDVASLPPQWRAALASELPLLDVAAIARLFESADVRDRLLGLWAAQETQRVDLLEPARALQNAPEAVLAEQARDVCARLERINEARVQVLVQMNIMAEAATALIRRLEDPAFIQTLKPRRADLAQLFDAELVDVAEQGIAQLYRDPHLIARTPLDASLEVHACPAGLLRWPNLLSDKFPGGYRALAGWMNPSRIWICWTTVAPNYRVSFDGLVWLDDHWCWLPKIFRLLVPYALNGGAGASRH